MAQMKKSTVLTLIVIVAGVVALAKFFNKPSQPGQTQATSPAGQGSMTIDPTSKKVSTVTHYSNPAGGDDVGFTLIVNSQGVITNVETQVLAQNQISAMRQQSFADAAPGVLVGKKLRELTAIDRVGSSSLTTGAFNASLGKLKAEL